MDLAQKFNELKNSDIFEYLDFITDPIVFSEYKKVKRDLKLKKLLDE